MQDAEGIGFVDVVAVTLRLDVEFVERAFGHAGNEALPDAGDAARGRAGCVRAPQALKLPTTETSARIRGPHAEHGAGYAVARAPDARPWFRRGGSCCLR